MKKPTNKQKNPSTELRSLTPYHWERNRAAGKEARKMLKHPYSLEQMLAQEERNRQIREHRKKES